MMSFGEDEPKYNQKHKVANEQPLAPPHGIISPFFEYGKSKESSRSFVEGRQRCSSVPDITGFYCYTDDSGKGRSREILHTSQEFIPGPGAHSRQGRRSSLAFPLSPELTLYDRECYSDSLISSNESSLNSITKVNAQVMVDILRWKFESGISIFPDLSHAYYDHHHDAESVLNKIFPTQPQSAKNLEIPVRKYSSSREPLDTGYSTAAKSGVQTYFSTNDVEIGTNKTDNQVSDNRQPRPSVPEHRRQQILEAIHQPNYEQCTVSIHGEPTAKPNRKSSDYPILTVKTGNPTLVKSGDYRTFYERIARTLASVVVLTLIAIIVTLIICTKD